MKTDYISPKTYTIVVNSSCEFLAGSTGGGVAADGTQVSLDGYRTDGDAGNAAARYDDEWEEEE